MAALAKDRPHAQPIADTSKGVVSANIPTPVRVFVQTEDGSIVKIPVKVPDLNNPPPAPLDANSASSVGPPPGPPIAITSITTSGKIETQITIPVIPNSKNDPEKENSTTGQPAGPVKMGQEIQPGLIKKEPGIVGKQTRETKEDAASNLRPVSRDQLVPINVIPQLPTIPVPSSAAIPPGPPPPPLIPSNAGSVPSKQLLVKAAVAVVSSNTTITSSNSSQSSGVDVDSIAAKTTTLQLPQPSSTSNDKSDSTPSKLGVKNPSSDQSIAPNQSETDASQVLRIPTTSKVDIRLTPKSASRTPSLTSSQIETPKEAHIDDKLLPRSSPVENVAQPPGISHPQIVGPNPTVEQELKASEDNKKEKKIEQRPKPIREQVKEKDSKPVKKSILKQPPKEVPMYTRSKHSETTFQLTKDDILPRRPQLPQNLPKEKAKRNVSFQDPSPETIKKHVCIPLVTRREAKRLQTAITSRRACNVARNEAQIERNNFVSYRDRLLSSVETLLSQGENLKSLNRIDKGEATMKIPLSEVQANWKEFEAAASVFMKQLQGNQQSETKLSELENRLVRLDNRLREQDEKVFEKFIVQMNGSSSDGSVTLVDDTGSSKAPPTAARCRSPPPKGKAAKFPAKPAYDENSEDDDDSNASDASVQSAGSEPVSSILEAYYDTIGDVTLMREHIHNLDSEYQLERQRRQSAQKAGKVLAVSDQDFYQKFFYDRAQRVQKYKDKL